MAAGPELAESGFLRYLLPRFSIKTGLRTVPVELAEDVEADILLDPESSLDGGKPLLRGDGELYLVRGRILRNRKHAYRFRRVTLGSMRVAYMASQSLVAAAPSTKQIETLDDNFRTHSQGATLLAISIGRPTR